MGNSRKHDTIFRFKKFHVKHELSAMKVGTDGVLLGAWMDISTSTSILDIGSGSGLISLMAAQRCNAKITAIEIDPIAANEAKENISASPWADRITIINDDFISWVKNNSTAKYDHIVSNPPFFSNGIIAADCNRAMARHGNGLDYNAIISAAPFLLSKKGQLSLISPVNRKDDIIFFANMAKMNISRLTEVSSIDGQSPIRLLWELSIASPKTVSQKLSIRKNGTEYSDEYMNLTKDFYLNM